MRPATALPHAFRSVFFRAAALCLPALAVMLLPGCTVGPDFVRPQPPQTDHYTRSPLPAATVSADGTAQRFTPSAQPAADWWKRFGSPQLDALVAAGFAGNPGVQAALANLQQSQDNLRAGYGVFYPQVNGDFNASRQAFSPARFGSNAPPSLFNLLTLSASVSYALDIFGGQRRTIEGLQAQTAFQQATVEATYLTLSGNLVNAAIAQAAYLEEIEATQQIIALQRRQLALTQTQAQAGTTPYSSVLALKSTLAASEATLPPLRQKLEQSRHLLATLAGHAPAQWTPPTIRLDELTLPQEIPVTLPSVLVRQRPDILAAEASLHAASAAIGVATAALYPAFTLDASYGQNNTSFGNLLQSNASFWSFGPDVSLPLFNGGTLRAQQAAASAGYRQALASYRQTVLAALAQVADAMRGVQHDAETGQAVCAARHAAQATLHLLQVNHQAGLVNSLQVITADLQYRQARLNCIQIQAQRLQDTTALLVALGGWWNLPA